MLPQCLNSIIHGYPVSKPLRDTPSHSNRLQTTMQRCSRKYKNFSRHSQIPHPEKSSSASGRHCTWESTTGSNLTSFLDDFSGLLLHSPTNSTSSTSVSTTPTIIHFSIFSSLHGTDPPNSYPVVLATLISISSWVDQST